MYANRMKLFYIYILSICILFVSCNKIQTKIGNAVENITESNINKVKNGVLEGYPTVTVGGLLEGYSYFQNKKWIEIKTNNGTEIVEFRTEYYNKDNYDDIYNKDLFIFSFRIYKTEIRGCSFELSTLTIISQNGTKQVYDNELEVDILGNYTAPIDNILELICNNESLF